MQASRPSPPSNIGWPPRSLIPRRLAPATIEHVHILDKTPRISLSQQVGDKVAPSLTFHVGVQVAE